MLKVLMFDSPGVSQVTPLQDRTVTDQVVRGIRRDIMLGHLKPGQRLGEVQLSEQLDVSRSTIREALRRLEAEYLVETISHRGSRVACLTPSDAVEICQLHAMLESWSVQRMPIPITAGMRQRLESLAEQMRLLEFPAGVDRFLELDRAFHRTIVDAASHRWVPRVWSDINALLGVLVTLSVRYLPLSAGMIGDRHQAIIDALVRPEGDRDGTIAVVGEHYESIARMLKESEQQVDTQESATT